MSMDTVSTGPATTEPATAAGDGRRASVVVGVDGSPGSRAALGYAVTAAARRGGALQVVATFGLEGARVGNHPIGVPPLATVRADLDARVRALVDDVRAGPALRAVPGTGDVPIAVVVSGGPAAPRLVDDSTDADLLVVGSRGRGAVRSVLLGSVALHCVTHAHCPVVVVHPAAAGHRPERTVVVGIDGSAASRAALVAALDEAARLATDVVAVTTFELVDRWTALSAMPPPDADQIRSAVQSGAEAMVDEVVAEHRARQNGRAPAVRAVVVEGPAVDVLIEWAADAELLVVGSRGHGELRGLLVGSVALACAMHGAGPVMVVHPQPARTAVASAPAAV
jgi:nucleotide-binding universal stress UspA family protein